MRARRIRQPPARVPPSSLRSRAIQPTGIHSNTEVGIADDITGARKRQPYFRAGSDKMAEALYEEGFMTSESDEANPLMKTAHRRTHLIW